jgi:hypothetical protein
MFLENKISRSLTTVGARYLPVSTVQYMYMGESTGWEETGMAEMSSWDQANIQKLGFGLEK